MSDESFSEQPLAATPAVPRPIDELPPIELPRDRSRILWYGFNLMLAAAVLWGLLRSGKAPEVQPPPPPVAEPKEPRVVVIEQPVFVDREVVVEKLVLEDPHELALDLEDWAKQAAFAIIVHVRMGKMSKDALRVANWPTLKWPMGLKEDLEKSFRECFPGLVLERHLWRVQGWFDAYARSPFSKPPGKKFLKQNPDGSYTLPAR